MAQAKAKNSKKSKKDEKPEELPPDNMVDAEEPLIEDLPGVGPATAEKLRDAGFDDMLTIAVMSPSDLADDIEIGESSAAKIIPGAKRMANIGGLLT